MDQLKQGLQAGVQPPPWATKFQSVLAAGGLSGHLQSVLGLDQHAQADADQRLIAIALLCRPMIPAT